MKLHRWAVLCLMSVVLILEANVAQAQLFHWEWLGGPGTSVIAGMETAPNGDIWVATEEAIFIHAQGQWRDIHLPDSIVPMPSPFDETKLNPSMTFGKSSNAVIVTNKGLLRVEPTGVYHEIGPWNYDAFWPMAYLGRDWSGAILVVSPGDTIFVSEDDGESWQTVLAPKKQSLNSVARDDSGKFYAATDSGLFQSKDSGLSWTRIMYDNSPDSLYKKLRMGYVALGPGGTVWAWRKGAIYSPTLGSRATALYFSPDRGKSWKLWYEYYDEAYPDPPAIDRNGLCLFPGRRTGDMFITTDSLPLRSVVPELKPVPFLRDAEAHVMLDSNGSWYVNQRNGNPLTGRNVYRCTGPSATDSTWSLFHVPGSEVTRLESLPFGLRVAVDRNGATLDYITTDEGKTWIELKTFEKGNPNCVASVAIGPNRIGMSSWARAVLSTDDGVSWNFVPEFGRYLSGLTIHSDTLYAILDYTNTLWTSTDFGASWRVCRSNVVDSAGSYFTLSNYGVQRYRASMNGTKDGTWPHGCPLSAAAGNKFLAIAYDNQCSLTGGLYRLPTEFSSDEHVAENQHQFLHGGNIGGGITVLDYLIRPDDAIFFGNATGVWFATVNDTIMRSASSQLVNQHANKVAISQDATLYAAFKGTGVWRAVADVNTLGVRRASEAASKSVCYPNPATDRVAVHGISSDVRLLRVVDALGKLRTISREGETFDTSKLPSGPYTIVPEGTFDEKRITFVIAR